MKTTNTNTFKAFFNDYAEQSQIIWAEAHEKLNRIREQCEDLEREAIRKIANLLLNAERPVSADEIAAFVPELSADSISAMLEYSARAYECGFYDHILRSHYTPSHEPTAKCYKYRDILPAIRKIKVPGSYIIACDEKGCPIPGAEPRATHNVLKFEAIKGEWLK